MRLGRDSKGHFLSRSSTKRRRAARRKGTTMPKVRVVRVSRRAHAARYVRRFGSAALQAARDEKHTLTAMAAGAALGYAERQKMQLPKIERLGGAGTWGIGAWVAARQFKSRVLRHVATGMLTVASYNFARTAGASTDSTSGDDEASGAMDD